MLKTIIETLQSMPPEEVAKLRVFVEGEMQKLNGMKTEDLFKDTDGLSQGTVEFTEDDLAKMMSLGVEANRDGLPPFFDTIIEQALTDAEQRRADAKEEDDEPPFDSVEDLLEYVKGLNLNVEHDAEWEDEVEPEDDDCCMNADEGADEGADGAVIPREPLFNISTTNDEKVVYLQIQVVGFNEDDITVELKHTNDMYLLEVTGVVASEEIEDEGEYKYQQKQFEVAPFTQQYSISEETYNGKLDVSMKNGILTVTSTPVEPKNTTKKVF